MKKSILLFAAVLLMVPFLAGSCKSKKRFLFDVVEQDYVNKSSQTVHGVEVKEQLPLGASDLFVCDTFIVVMTSGGQQPRMHVYSTNWQPLGEFCNIGRARNEFLSYPKLLSGQYYRKPDGTVLVPLMDGASNGVKMMDLTESVRRQTTVITRYREDLKGIWTVIANRDNMKIKFGSRRDVILLNEDMNLTFEYNNSVNDYPDYYGEPYFGVRQDTTEIRRIRLLQEVEGEEMEYFGGRIIKHPHRNLIVQPLSSLDYILFFDMDNDHMFAVHQKGSASFDGKLPEYVRTEGVTEDGTPYYEDNLVEHFGYPAFAESYFMVLYYAGDYGAGSADPENPVAELMFFDWDGKFLKSVKLDTSVWSITYDENNHILYGMDMFTESLYSFDLTSVLPD